MSCNIELEIGAGSGPGEFITRVVHAASGGEPSATMRLDVDGLLRDRDTLETTVLASAVPARLVRSGGAEKLRDIGQQLFEALFSGPVRDAYRASKGVAVQKGAPLRVVLRLTAPQLAALPWRRCLTPTLTLMSAAESRSSGTSPLTTPAEPTEVVTPLRVLGLVSSPRGMPPLDVAAEQDHLSKALARPIAEGRIYLEWLPQASWEDVQEKLLSPNQWHVLHFVGHGDYDTTADQGFIALVDDDGRTNLVGAENLADLLYQPDGSLRLVVLNRVRRASRGRGISSPAPPPPWCTAVLARWPPCSSPSAIVPRSRSPVASTPRSLMDTTSMMPSAVAASPSSAHPERSNG